MFVTERWSHYGNKLHTQSGSGVVTQLAVDFHAYLVDAHEASTGTVDEHLKMIAGFILTVNNLHDFIDSYGCQDSIGAENGYHMFAPVWKMNGRSKYVQCWIEQLS